MLLTGLAQAVCSAQLRAHGKACAAPAPGSLCCFASTSSDLEESKEGAISWCHPIHVAQGALGSPGGATHTPQLFAGLANLSCLGRGAQWSSLQDL